MNILAVLMGLGAGALTATIIALGLGGALTVLDAGNGADIGLVAGVVTGLAVAGWVSGRFARHSERFHGSVTALLLAGLIVVVARLGGSPAPTASVLWLALIAIVVGGSTGWLAGRRKGTTT